MESPREEARRGGNKEPAGWKEVGQHPGPTGRCADGDGSHQPWSCQHVPFPSGSSTPLAGAALGLDAQCPCPLCAWSRCHRCESEGGDLGSSRLGGKTEKRSVEVGAALTTEEQCILGGHRREGLRGCKKNANAFQVCPATKGEDQATPDLVTAISAQGGRAWHRVL